MRAFLIPKKKFFELGILLVLDLILFLMWLDVTIVILFTLGFVWNWVASQELEDIFLNKRYRFSMLKLVKNLQALIQKPFKRLPALFQFIARVLPAGLFWLMVVYFNDSLMPWWMTFAGSLAFEISQLEVLQYKKNKESLP